MEQYEVDSYLESLKQALLNDVNFKPIELSRNWAGCVPAAAGVYVLKQKENVVYVGETGDLRGRMYDLLNTLNHCVRRTIGERYFSGISGYKPANAKTKFPDHIEKMVDDYISQNLRVSYLPIALGRKELEESIVKMLPKEQRFNKRGKRSLAL